MSNRIFIIRLWQLICGNFILLSVLVSFTTTGCGNKEHGTDTEIHLKANELAFDAGTKLGLKADEVTDREYFILTYDDESDNKTMVPIEPPALKPSNASSFLTNNPDWFAAGPGACVSVKFFGADGQPRGDLAGVFRRKFDYDINDNLSEIAHFDVDGKPTTLDIGVYKGVRKISFRYDNRGNLIEKAYFDSESQPMIIDIGYHKFVVEYDDNDKPIELSYYDEFGGPSAVSWGEHRVLYEYTDGEFLTAVEMYAANGDKTIDLNSVHRYEYSYGADGEVTTETGYNVKGQIVPFDE